MRMMLNEMVCATSFRFVLSSCLLAGCATTDIPTPSATTETLVGRWDVSLYYSPDAEPSKTEMVITSVEDGTLAGTFYGTPFSDVSRATQRGEIIAFTAVTADGTGDYIHSGRLRDDRVDGQTLSEGRGFLMTWRAERLPDDPEG